MFTGLRWFGFTGLAGLGLGVGRTVVVVVVVVVVAGLSVGLLGSGLSGLLVLSGLPRGTRGRDSTRGPVTMSPSVVGGLEP